MSQTSENRLTTIIQGVLGEDNQLVEIGLDQPLAALGITSANFIKLVVDVENEFDLEFDDDFLDVNMLETFGDLLSYITKKIQQD